MRLLFDHWGIELDDDTFARAVAGRVVEIGYGERHGAPWRWPNDGWRAVRRIWTTSARGASGLAEQWQVFAAAHPNLRAVVPDIERAREDDGRFAFEVLHWLGRAAPPFGSIVADTGERPKRLHEWGWPLRVGIAPSRDRPEIVRQSAFPQFLHVEEVHPTRGLWDILIVPGTLTEAIAILAGATPIHARCVLIAGREDDVPTLARGPTLAAVRTLAEAYAVIIARPKSRDRAVAGETHPVAALLNATAWELSHDQPIDAALFGAMRSGSISEPPLISGHLPFFDSTRPSRRLQRVADKLIATADQFKFDLPRLGALPGMGRVEAAAGGTLGARRRGGALGARDMGRALKRYAAEVEWHQEARGATGTAMLAEAVADTLARAAEASPPRYLQTGARKVETDAESESWSKHLETRGTYALYVWIGALDRRALALPEPFPKLPNEHDTHELEVVLSEPNLLSRSLVGTLLLPPLGESTRCRFLVHCRSGIERIEARVVVLHRGRVLQTGIVRGAIVPPGAQPTVDGQLRFELDATPRRRLATLGRRSMFGAAIIANHLDDGTPHELAIVGRRVARIKLGDTTLQAITDRFNAAISAIAAEPEKFAGLRAAGTVALLRDLAQHGATLHEAIYKHNEVGPSLATEPRLQIVTARVDGFLPLELAYRFEAPEDDATLCEGAEDALATRPAATGDAGACAAKCGPKPGGTGARVCPMGFWCLWKTIERFAHRTEAINEDADFSVFAEPIGRRPHIPTPTSALVAASELAKAHDPKAVDRVVGLMGTSFEVTSQAQDWQGWADAITSSHPGLLVLLPHHARQEGTSLLEIGTHSALKSTLVKYRHVVGEPPAQPPGTPIVLLLGCETHDAPIALERFPAAFQARGAAVVVGTIATVLGRHAGPAAEALIASLTEKTEEERSFGDLVLAVRRKLLLEGKAMGLALAGFGDADWRIL